GGERDNRKGGGRHRGEHAAREGSCVQADDGRQREGDDGDGRADLADGLAAPQEHEIPVPPEGRDRPIGDTVHGPSFPGRREPVDSPRAGAAAWHGGLAPRPGTTARPRRPGASSAGSGGGRLGGGSCASGGTSWA